jgi:hypothetical protein
VKRPQRRWLRATLIILASAVVALLIAFSAFGGWSLIGSLRGPGFAYDPSAVPPPPDYTGRQAWLAFPGQNGLERSTPAGLMAIDERAAPTDVFFVHPTTFRGSAVWVAPFDASDAAAPLNPVVLLGQVSVFNGCCRLYAPRYRQATLAALKEPRAMQVAYSDVAAAFRFYISHRNRGRPFIIASHSQGTAHAIRLLQAEILGTPLQRHLVAAYLIGGYVPDTFGALGLPICAGARQTGCVISYNTSQAGRTGARMITENRTYWWRGALTTQGRSDALCVNPLTWRPDRPAAAAANPGSLPFPAAPFGSIAKRMPALVPQLTGAKCRVHLLEVDIPWSAPAGFTDKLSWLFGSYHLNDYGIFYAAIRQNAIDRVAAWRIDAVAAGNHDRERDTL